MGVPHFSLLLREVGEVVLGPAASPLATSDSGTLRRIHAASAGRMPTKNTARAIRNSTDGAATRAAANPKAPRTLETGQRRVAVPR